MTTAMRLPLSLAGATAGIICVLLASGTSLSGSPKLSVVKPGLIKFHDIARQAGLTAVNVYGSDSQKEFIIETTGNGAIIFDYDDDGWPDIFLPTGSTVGGPREANAAPTNHLYHNQRDGTFLETSVQAGLDRSGWAQGGCVGDYDNDGHLDLLVTSWGQNQLFHNNGDGTFSDFTDKAGLKTQKAEWSTGCSFVDYDRDGKADLLISRYVDFSFDSVPGKGQGKWCKWKGIDVMCGPRGLKFAKNILYHNAGQGKFTDVSKAAGIESASDCYGFTTLAADFDHDGWPDIYVACDSTPNILYHNKHDGTFVDVANTSGLAYNQDGALQAGMGLSAADYLHKGHQDIVKTNFSDDTATLYLNRGQNNFDDVTYSAGIGSVTQWLGWGVQFYDFDNSGWPDILIANGHVYPEVDGKDKTTSYRQPKIAYYNLHNGAFANISGDTGVALSERHSGRGMALGDLFNNGHEAALVNNMNEAPSLYYNTARVQNFISLKLIGVKSNRAALGAVVTLEQGGDLYESEVRSGGGFISQSDLRLHFGLGSATKAEALTIRWPSGSIEKIKALAANKYYVIREGRGVDALQTREPSGIVVKPPSQR
jgi:hypothetical protein